MRKAALAARYLQTSLEVFRVAPAFPADGSAVETRGTPLPGLRKERLLWETGVERDHCHCLFAQKELLRPDASFTDASPACRLFTRMRLVQRGTWLALMLGYESAWAWFCVR